MGRPDKGRLYERERSSKSATIREANSDYVLFGDGEILRAYIDGSIYSVLTIFKILAMYFLDSSILRRVGLT